MFAAILVHASANSNTPRHATEKALGPKHPQVASALGNLAQCLALQGRFKDAEPLYLRALGILQEALGSEHPESASALNNLGTLYLDRRQYSKAEPLLLRALAIIEKQIGPVKSTLTGQTV
jgi:tetratricopeptide (TPR) repeat protein